jgi:uncharacterized protein (DUF58 family)
MNSPAPLVPSVLTAVCHAARRFSFSFGPRFFVVLLAGAVFLGPAWWDHRFAVLMLLWDALVFLAWFADCRRLPAPAEVEISREWPDAVALDSHGEVVLRIENRSALAFHAELTDTVPADWRMPFLDGASPDAGPPRVDFDVAARASAEGRYAVHPQQRGDASVGTVYVRLQSGFRLAERWMLCELRQTVRVYPNLAEARRLTLYLIRSRQVQMERRLKFQIGKGREFESLREYRPGDEKRDICWTATARRGKLVTRTYQHERSQSVMLVVDAGRLMLAHSEHNSHSSHSSHNSYPTSHPATWTKLDHAISAALALAQVAMRSGDRAGLLAYGRKLQARLAPGRGSGQFRIMLDSLAVVRGELSEAAHSLAADTLLLTQSRRGLVLWLTDLAETAATPEVIEAASRIARRHLLLFVAMGQPLLKGVLAQRPQTPLEMYRYTAAAEMVQRRELLLGRLRQQGARVLDLDPTAVAPAVVNEYLRVKEQGLL